MTFSIERGYVLVSVFFFQAEDGIRDLTVTGVQTCALPISRTLVRWLNAAPIANESGASRASSMARLSRASDTSETTAPFASPSIARTIAQIGRASCRERV